MTLDENRFRRPAAERLDPDRARPGKNIQKPRAHNQRRQHIKNSFAQPVARRPQRESFERLQLTRTKLPGNHAHRFGNYPIRAR